jgi:hypothetical protein
MANESNDPGFLSSLIASLKPKDSGPIPQVWLNAMLANSTVLNTQVKSLLNIVTLNDKDVVLQNRIQISILDNISKSMGPSLKQTLIDSYKAYDKEIKNSNTVKDENERYKQRKVEGDATTRENNKVLAKDITSQLSNNVTATSKGINVDEGAAAAEDALAEIPVQPVSIVSVEPEAIEALKKIFSTAVSSTPAGKKEAPTESGNVGILGALGNGLGSLGDGLKKLGTKEAMLGALTLIELGVALVVSAKGFQMFSDVKWEGMAKGFVALLGLVGITKLLASSSVEMIIGASAIAVLGLALIAAGKGFQMFGELDWAAIGKGFTAILGLGAVAVLFGALSEVIIPGAIALGLLGLALIPFSVALLATAKAFNMFIKPMDEFTKQLDNLNNIGPGNLFELAGAITALGVAIAGFGAGAAVAGIGNFVGGLFNSLSGQKSPIDQLITIGQQASNIERVSSSIGLLRENLTSFGNSKFDLSASIDKVTQSVFQLKQSLSDIQEININLNAFSSAAERVNNLKPSNTAEVTGPSAAVNTSGMIQTESGPALPVSLVSAKLATSEAAKLNFVTTTPDSKEIENGPSYKLQETQVRISKTIVLKLEELIKTLAPAINALGQGNSIINNSSSPTLLNSTTSNNAVVGGGGESNRDIPYIERNKYRQTMMYARGLL